MTDSIRSNFIKIVNCHLKAGVSGLSHVIVSMNLRLAVFEEHRLVTERWTARVIDGRSGRTDSLETREGHRSQHSSLAQRRVENNVTSFTASVASR